MNFALAWKIALRELRGGLSGFRIFLLCLALGVAAIAAVGSVRMAIQEGLTREASSLLGGDAELQFTYRYASDEEWAWMEERAEAISEVVDFRSMLVAGDARNLTQVQGVDGAYPLYGALELVPDMPLEQALETSDGVPGLIAEQILLDRMGLAPGDRVKLGTQEFELRAGITYQPDGSGAGFTLGPRVVVLTKSLADSGLLTQGTLFETEYRLKLPAGTNLERLKTQAEETFIETGMRWRDVRNASPRVTRFIERMGSFLVLVGLAGLAVGGVGVSAAVRAYLEGKTATIATLKTLGATGATIFSTYLIQIGILALFGVTGGLVLGAAVPKLFGPLISAQLPVPALFDVYFAPMAEAAFYGILTALIFTVWPLARARDIRAASLFRDAISPGKLLPRWTYLLLVAVLVATLIGTAAYLSGIPTLALWASAGVLAALFVLVLAAQVVRWITRRLARSRLARGRPALRMALGSVGGPGGETASVVLSLGLGLTVLATIGQIDANMQRAISQDLPLEAPAYFFLDVQNTQLPEFQGILDADEQVSRIDTAPMLRGIVTQINGQPAREVAGEHWVVRGDRGITYAQVPLEGSEITDGEWWPEDYSGPPLLSFAEEEALELGLGVGDTVTVNILGRDITATIANLRNVEFRNMGINFVMTLNPAAVAGAPHTHIATVYADPEAESRLLKDLSERFPNITAIRVRDAIGRVTDALNAIASATRYGAAATLLTGFVVLIGAAAAGERSRVFEAAVLKTLGAVRGLILASFALRSAILGAAAGLVAIAAGAIAGWGVMTFVMNADYQFEPFSALAIVMGGALASLIAGLLFALRPLGLRPAGVLRARE